MCQPKSGTGVRCLVHAAASKFVMRITVASTKADAQTVKNVLKELNKEGKKLPTPETAEVAQWIDTQRFAAQYDPSLSSHDRKIGLNQLKKAEEEVGSVTGGKFHAWKNLRETVNGKIARRAAALSLTPLIAFGAAGCATGANPFSGDEANTGGNASISQEYSPSDIPDWSVTGGEQVTDELGTYGRAPASAWETDTGYNINGLEAGGLADMLWGQHQAEAEAAGFTKEEFTTAIRQSYGVNYEVLFDSAILDRDVTNEQYQAWYQETVVDKYNPTQALSEDLGNPANTIVPKGFGSESGGNTVPFVRDGNKRYLSEGLGGSAPQLGSNIVNPTVSFKTIDGQAHMGVVSQINMPYRLSDANAIAMQMKHTGGTAESVQASVRNDLSDNVGDNILLANGKSTVVFSKTADNQLTLTGTQVDFVWDAKHMG